METTITSVLTDPSVRTGESIQASIASELSAGAPWWDEAA